LYPDDGWSGSIVISNRANLYEVPGYQTITKYHGREVNTPTSYSEGHRFDSWLQRLAILIQGFWGFSQSLQVNAEIIIISSSSRAHYGPRPPSEYSSTTLYPWQLTTTS
jgi:hypothetical protein